MQLCDENQFLTGRRNSTKKKHVEKLNVVLWKISHSIKLPNAAALSRRGTILFFFNSTLHTGGNTVYLWTRHI